jgi:hypothetical protein
MENQKKYFDCYRCGSEILLCDAFKEITTGPNGHNGEERFVSERHYCLYCVNARNVLITDKESMRNQNLLIIGSIKRLNDRLKNN